MTTKPSAIGAPLSFVPKRFARDYLGKRLRLFEAGSLSVELPNGETLYHVGERPGPQAAVVLKRWRSVAKLLAEGEIGLARSYVDGDWSTPDLEAVLDFGLANAGSLTFALNGVGPAHLINRWRHRRNQNTRRGSRRNIAAHYDLGNRFYALWLDPEMIYSSGIYQDVNDTLETAQRRKLDRVVELMGLEGGEDVLEIGCGWGGLARHIAEAGARQVTGISLSREQIEYAQARTAGTAYATPVSLEFKDYRSVEGRYDRIVSIEMFEAVGERYWPVFFEHLQRCMKQGGTAVLQIITIAEELFDSYRRRPDFIQQYIFPGGMLPTRQRVEEEARRAGFQVTHYEPFGASYAATLDAWRQRFHANWSEIEQLGFDGRFQRMWDFYLAYCAAGFRHGSTNVGLFKLQPVT